MHHAGPHLREEACRYDNLWGYSCRAWTSKYLSTSRTPTSSRTQHALMLPCQPSSMPLRKVPSLLYSARTLADLKGEKTETFSMTPAAKVVEEKLSRPGQLIKDWKGQAHWHGSASSYLRYLRGRPHCRDRGRDHLEEISAERKRHAEGDSKGFLSYADEAFFSTNFKTNPTSSPSIPGQASCWIPTL